MSGVLHGILAGLAGAKDTFWKYVTLLLPGNGTNGAQNNTFIDGSTNNFTITRNGNTTQGTFTPFGSNWSNYFDGTGDYLSGLNDAAFAFGTGDFTIEYWAYSANVSSPAELGILQTSDTSGGLKTTYTTGIVIAQGVTGSGKIWVNVAGTALASASAVLVVNTWQHIAVVRSGSTVTAYVNGTSAVSGTASGNCSGQNLAVGGYYSTAYLYSGYLSNLRIVKGTAVYTADFTPPTSPLTAITNTSLLTCQSNRFVDNSTNAFTITPNGDVSVQRFSPFNPTDAYSTSVIGGSGYFDGTGDYLSDIGTVSSFNFMHNSTALFTFEFWIYRTVISTDQAIWDDNAWGSSNVGATVAIAADNKVYLTIARGVTSSLVITAASNSTIPISTWTHIAITYDQSLASNNAKIYINGVLDSQTTKSANAPSNSNSAYPYRIGLAHVTNAYPLAGYLSNLRVTNAVVYTSNFTPPTSPLTAITNTSLLLNFTNAGIIDNAMLNDLETVGNAQISTAQSKFGGSSIAFDGAGDWLVSPNATSQQLDTGNFTIEGWLRLSATGVAYGIVSKGTSTTGWSVNVTSGNKLQFSYTATQLTGATSIAANTWYHFAVVRNGSAAGNLVIYLDGVADATSAGAVNDNFNQTSVQYVGASRTGTDSLNGYIDDLRITKGVARYTANFTPPAAAFPTS